MAHIKFNHFNASAFNSFVPEAATRASNKVINNILLFGGMRDSNYFHESIYFNRKILIFNTLNSTFAVSNW